MELTVFFKMLFDCSAILIWGGFLGSMFGDMSLLTAPALLCALAAALGYLARDKRPFLRMAPASLPLAGLLFCRTLADTIVCLLLWGYVAYVLWKGLFLNDGDDFKTTFQRVFSVCLVPCFLSALTLRSGVMNRLLLPFLFIQAVCGVMLTRSLRHSRETIESASFKLTNIITIALVCLLTLVLSSHALLSAVGDALGFVYQKIIMPVIMAVIVVVTRFLSLFSRLFAMIFHRKVVFYEEGESSPAAVDKDFGDEVTGEIPPLVTYIAIAAAAAIAAVIVVIALKALAGKNRRFDRKEGMSMARETIELPRENRHGIFSSRDPREQVRRQYRRFLKECLERGFPITPDMDTSQIRLGAEGFFPGGPLDELRQVYIEARYSPHEVTSPQVKEASGYVSRLKSIKLTGPGK